MLTMIVILFVLTSAITLALKYIVTPRYGQDVEARFIERSRTIPSRETGELDCKSLASWLADKRNTNAISGYIFPVIFPLDMIFLVCLGLFLGRASIALVNRLDLLSNVPSWIWWILPTIYMLSDLAEDLALVGIFKSTIPLTNSHFSWLKRFTAVKLATVSGAIGQAGFLVALSILIYEYPAHN